MFAETCVFDKQSLPPFHCDPQKLHQQVMLPSRACLLPKLRHQFAEFLNKSSPKRLRILSSSTCVGLRYGLIIFSMRNFSGKLRITHFSLGDRIRVSELIATRICLGHPPTHLNGHPNRPLRYLSPSFLHVKRTLPSTGILTCYPSITPFGLTLGSD